MKTALIVDDHYENYYLSESLLKHIDYQTVWAKNGTEALEMVQSNPPELIISDILMPVMDGFGLCREVKKDPSLCNIPFIFYTASYIEPADKEFALSLGADGFITKGADPDDFYSDLKTILDQITTGTMHGDPVQVPEDPSFYRMYNEVLISKLEQKLLELEDLNHSLNASESGYRHLFENNPVPMWVYDLETFRFLSVNNEAVRKYGYSQAEFLSMTLMDIRPVEDLPDLLENLKDPDEDSRPTGYWRHLLKNGEIIYVEITSREIEFNGKISRLVMAQDITQRKLAEDALRNSEGNLKKAQEIAQMGSWVWYIPANHYECSDQVFQILGLDPETQEGLGLVESFMQAVLPEDQEQFSTQINTFLLNKEPISLETRIRRRDGEIRHLWVGAGEYILDHNGSPLILRGILQDISERKQAEKQLRENEERLRTAMVAASQGVFEFDVLAQTLVLNDSYASLLGYTDSDQPRPMKVWLDRVHDEDLEKIQSILQAGLQNIPSPVSIEFRVKKACGDYLWIIIFGSAIVWDKDGNPTRFLGVFRDITERKNDSIRIAGLLQESQKRLKLITSQHEIDKAINSTQGLNPTLEMLVSTLKEHLEIDATAILLFDEGNNEFRCAKSHGFKTDIMENATVDFTRSVAGQAARLGRMIHLAEYAHAIDAKFDAFLKIEGIVDYYAVPLISKGRLEGVLEVFHRSPINPDFEWKEYYEALAGQTAVAIEMAKLMEYLQKANEDLSHAYDATIEGWSLAMDLRDKETEGHTQRVVNMTVELARQLGFPEEDLVHVRRGALLHDIGKIGIPDAILLKPGELSLEERVIIQEHPKYAEKMLNTIEYLHPAIDIPHYHHEKWDGTGYPDGLKGEQIPRAARLFAIVDVYDALTSDRYYRKAWSEENAVAYIQQESGKHFDPEIAKLFVQYWEQEHRQA